MRGKRLFWTGIIGFAVGLIALLITILIPVMNPRTSWGEALVGIIPSAILTVVFLFLIFMGMYAMMESNERGRRRRRDYDDETDDDDRPVRRRGRRFDDD